MNDLVVDFATSTSTIPLSAYGEDFDGSFYSMQFYVDGQVYGSEIFRPSGIEQDLVNYSELLQLNSPGIYSIFAIGGTTVVTMLLPVSKVFLQLQDLHSLRKLKW